MHKICINMPLHKLDFNKGKYAVICKHKQLYAQKHAFSMHKYEQKNAINMQLYAKNMHKYVIIQFLRLQFFQHAKIAEYMQKMCTKMQKNCCAQNKHKTCRICTVNLCNGVFCKYMLHSSLCSWLRPDVTVGPPAALGHWQGPRP